MRLALLLCLINRDPQCQMRRSARQEMVSPPCQGAPQDTGEKEKGGEQESTIVVASEDI